MPFTGVQNRYGGIICTEESLILAILWEEILCAGGFKGNEKNQI